MAFILCLIKKFYILTLLVVLSILLYNFIINSPHNKRTLLKMNCSNILYIDQYGKIYEN